MAYAVNLSQVQTVTEQTQADLVFRASMLDDKMLDNLKITVTTDVENVNKLFVFNDKGLVARQYKAGAVKKVQLGKMVENPAKVILAVTHPQDNVQQYREKEPFHVNPDGTTNAEQVAFLTDRIAKRHAEDVRANFFFGNEANANLPETAANQVKLGLSLYDGIYTKIAQAKTKGYISVAIGNMVETGDINGKTSEQVYAIFKTFVNGLHPDLQAKDEILIYASREFCDKCIEGYMLKHPQLSPSVLVEGWKFATMSNITLVCHSAMGKGGQLIATVPGNLEYVCDIRPESQASITVERNNDDHNLFDYQVQTAQASRVRDYSAKLFCTNDAVNTPLALPAGDYVADVFTVDTSDEAEGSAAITSGTKDLYAEGDIITVTATPQPGYVFKGWNDGATANPYNYTFTGGVVNLVAMFDATEASSSSVGTTSSGD